MDEDDEREFSSGIVLGFLDQAESTFKSMDAALYVSPPRPSVSILIMENSKAKNLTELSHLGHFLKGSSATLGFNKVKDECEKIQRESPGHVRDCRSHS
jgi:osomolarity two-component system, phosphorelay intermediate protein YPD1